MRCPVRFELVYEDMTRDGDIVLDASLITSVLNTTINDDGDDFEIPDGASCITLSDGDFWRVRGTIDETMAKLEKAWSKDRELPDGLLSARALKERGK